MANARLKLALFAQLKSNEVYEPEISVHFLVVFQVQLAGKQLLEREKEESIISDVWGLPFRASYIPDSV